MAVYIALLYATFIEDSTEVVEAKILKGINFAFPFTKWSYVCIFHYV